jgi:hypothetical protein
VKIYADFLLARGFRQVIESIREDLYWTSGAEEIRRRVEPAGVRVTRVPVNSEDSASTISDRTNNRSPVGDGDGCNVRHGHPGAPATAR